MEYSFDDGHDPFVSFDGDSDSDNSELSRKLILVSSVFLSVVMVLVFSLYLYTRCVLITPQSRSRRLGLTLHLHHTELAPPPTAGLDPALVAALPVFTVEPKAREAGGVTTECAVCLSALQGEEMAKLLPNCKHSFHVGCIDTWLASHSTCPLCRARVQPRLEPQLREGPALPLDDAAPLLVFYSHWNLHNVPRMVVVVSHPKLTSGFLAGKDRPEEHSNRLAMMAFIKIWRDSEFAGWVLC